MPISRRPHRTIKRKESSSFDRNGIFYRGKTKDYRLKRPRSLSRDEKTISNLVLNYYDSRHFLRQKELINLFSRDDELERTFHPVLI